MQDVIAIADSVLSPVALTALIVFMYAELRSLKRELNDIKKTIRDMDAKIDNITRNVAYIEGRLNGAREGKDSR